MHNTKKTPKKLEIRPPNSNFVKQNFTITPQSVYSIIRPASKTNFITKIFQSENYHNKQQTIPININMQDPADRRRKIKIQGSLIVTVNTADGCLDYRHAETFGIGLTSCIYYLTDKGIIVPGSSAIPLTLQQIHQAAGYQNKLRTKEREKKNGKIERPTAYNNLRATLIDLFNTHIRFIPDKESEIKNPVISSALDLIKKGVKLIDFKKADILTQNNKKSEGIILAATPALYNLAKGLNLIQTYSIEPFKCIKQTDRQRKILLGILERVSTITAAIAAGQDITESNYQYIDFDRIFKFYGIKFNNRKAKSLAHQEIKLILNVLIRDTKLILKGYKTPTELYYKNNTYKLIF